MDANETKVYTALMVAAVIAGILLLYFIATIIRQQRRHHRLYLEKVSAEINTLEKERSRLVADLHDELGPLLASARLYLEAVEPREPAGRDVLEQAGYYIDEVIGRIRLIANNLVPQVLERKGLVLAIREFMDGLPAPAFSLTQLDLSEAPLEMTKMETIHVYRLVQELVHNARKHASATELSIRLHQKDSRISLTVEDNGRGFQLEDVTIRSRGMGLKNISSRVDVLQGSLYIDTAPGRGSRFLIEWPVKPPHA